MFGKVAAVGQPSGGHTHEEFTVVQNWTTALKK